MYKLVGPLSRACFKTTGAIADYSANQHGDIVLCNHGNSLEAMTYLQCAGYMWLFIPQSPEGFKFSNWGCIPLNSAVW